MERNVSSSETGVGTQPAQRCRLSCCSVRNTRRGLITHWPVCIGSRRSEAVPEKYPTHLPTIAPPVPRSGLEPTDCPLTCPPHALHSPHSPSFAPLSLQNLPRPRYELFVLTSMGLGSSPETVPWHVRIANATVPTIWWQTGRGKKNWSCKANSTGRSTARWIDGRTANRRIQPWCRY